MKRRRSPPPVAGPGARSTAGDDDLTIALHRLLDKLLAHQPTYTEDDVAEISFPADSSSSPSRSPSRPEGCDPTVDGTEPRLASQTDEKKPAGAAAAASSPTTPVSSSSFVSLDGPLSAGLFLTAVNLFEPKLILKNRRVSADALKLVRQGYALVWHDPGYVTLASNGVGPSAPLGHRSERCSPSLSRSPLPSTLSQSPAPQFQADPAHVAVLDLCVQTLLVYTNNSAPLRLSITSCEEVLRLFCFLCSAARELDWVDHGSIRKVRNAGAELSSYNAVWTECGLAGRVALALRECYLTEFLLDAALPPAVCSARYEGLVGSLYSKKQRIILDIISNKQGFVEIMRAAPLRGLVGVSSMAAFAEPKLRARLLDKMCVEGLVERLLEEVSGACERLQQLQLAGSLPVTTRTPSKPAPMNKPERKSKSTSPWKAQPSPPPSPTQSGRTDHDASTPVAQLGQCLDVLLLLTSSNLRPPWEAEELARNPKTSASAVVRSCVWADREETLHCLLEHLLWIVSFATLPVRQWLQPLQAHAADCVLQMATYSGCLYGMVAAAMDSLITGLKVTTAPRSPNRSPSLQPPVTTLVSTAAALDDPRGLLPLVLRMLQCDTHTEANAGSIRLWFQWISDHVLPEVFEVPTLTTGRRSSAQWGRLRMESLDKSRRASSVPLPGEARAPVLARDLRRDELHYLSPFFSFSTRLVAETIWRDGVEPFFAKMALLSYHVVLHYTHRPTLYFGQASACYDAVAPLLKPVSGVVPGSPNPRSEATTGEERGQRPSAGGESVHLFIPSPSRSPVFFEAYSPTGSAGNRQSRRRTEASDDDGRGSDTEEQSPPSMLPRSWLSLRMLLARLPGGGGTPEEDASGPPDVRRQRV